MQNKSICKIEKSPLSGKIMKNQQTVKFSDIQQIAHLRQPVDLQMQDRCQGERLRLELIETYAYLHLFNLSVCFICFV